MNRCHANVGLALAIAASAISFAHAVERTHDDDVKAGHDLALTVCSTCHVVARDQRYPVSLTHPVPAFEDIANRPETTTESLQRFLSGTHWDMKSVPMTMPDLMLMEGQKRDVTAYIMSLRRK